MRRVWWCETDGSANKSRSKKVSPEDLRFLEIYFAFLQAESAKLRLSLPRLLVIKVDIHGSVLAKDNLSAGLSPA